MATAPTTYRRRCFFRRLFEVTLLLLAGLLVFRVICAEPYSVPTGSMAPTLLGHHRALDCPRCGYPIHVGFRADRPGDPLDALCPNCGSNELHLERVPV